MTILINKELAEKVLNTVSYGLVKGLGQPILGQMCVEAAVNYACGLPHSDKPSCVGNAVRNYKIKINDSNWSSNKARAEGMKAIAIAQLGSNTIDQKEFSNKIILKTINTIIADVAQKYKYPVEEDLRKCMNLVKAKRLCNELKTYVQGNKSVYYDAYAAAAAADAAYAAAYAAAADAAAAAADAAYAAAAAADAAAYAADTADAAAYAADADAADAYALDKVLIQASNNCLEVLKEMNSPGCEFLYLLDTNKPKDE